jgi:hypothetical protein
MPKVLIDINQIVRVHSNHGGYLGADCILCGAGGWLDGKYGYAHGVKDPDKMTSNRLVHKKKCAMNKYAMKVFSGD